jgi:microcystin-dependent protein
MSEPLLGEIKMFAGNFAPRGWALCDGQLLAISSNQALFSILGTTYGGNGTTNFALPNLQGRVPMHVGTGFIEGQTGGAASVTLTIANLPAHSHAVNCNSSASGTGGSTFAEGTGQNPSGHYPGPAPSPSQAVYATSANATMNGSMIAATGSGSAVSTLPPYQVVNFIIALQGIFPSRN